MFTTRNSKFVVIVVIAAISLLTVSFAAAPKANPSYQDFTPRHSSEVVLSAASLPDNTGSDYYERHKSGLELAHSPDLTDYFMRHPELSASLRQIDTTDYYFRQR